MKNTLLTIAALFSCGAIAQDTMTVNFTGTVASACEILPESQTTIDFGELAVGEIGYANLSISLLCTNYAGAIFKPVQDVTVIQGTERLELTLHNNSMPDYYTNGNRITNAQPFTYNFSDSKTPALINFKVRVEGEGAQTINEYNVVVNGKPLTKPQVFSGVLPIVVEY